MTDIGTMCREGFFGDKKKFLDQFDVAEKAIIHANKGASEQALTAYLDEVSKKKRLPRLN